MKGFTKTKEQRLALLESKTKTCKTNRLNYEMTFKPLISQPKRCQYCNVLALKHADVTCTQASRRCDRCADPNHSSKDCIKHWSKYYCVSCEIGGHSAYDRRRCPLLVELEEVGCQAELQRLRKELGKPISLSTDPNAKSYKAAVEQNIMQELEELKKSNNKIQRSLEKNQDNKGLLKDFQRLLEQNNKKILTNNHNQICENIKKFRIEFNQEVDHKIQIAKFEMIKILKEQGLLQNYNYVQPNVIDYNTKFDELFKSQEENYDQEDDDDGEESENMDTNGGNEASSNNSRN